jgi:hypothetical protein
VLSLPSRIVTPELRVAAICSAGAIALCGLLAAGCSSSGAARPRAASAALPTSTTTSTAPASTTTTVPPLPTTVPCPPQPTAVLTSTTTSQTDTYPETSPPTVDWDITAYGTFTNPSQYPVEMNVDLVVNSTPVYPGPTETHQFGVYASNPAQLGLVPGNTTINWQQDTGATEWIGGQPTDSILTGWSYASAALVHCDQTP